MKEKIKNLIKRGKLLGNTLFTILLILLIIAIVVAINIVVEEQDIADIDLTSEKLYSLSQESIDKIKTVTSDTKLTLYNMTDYDEVMNYVKLYNQENSHITYEELTDVTTRPDLQEEYSLGTSITSAAIIVETASRSKIVFASNFYTYDYNTYEQYDITEQTITNAILDVNLEKTPKVYFSTNHASGADYFLVAQAYLENEGNEVEDLDILVKTEIPDDCDLLVLTTLDEDLSEFERDVILTYINNGGNLLILADPNTSGIELPNFQTILDYYGASISTGVVYEQNTDKIVGYANVVIPTISSSSDITKYIESDGAIAIVAGGIIEYKSDEELESMGVERTDIVNVSDSAFLRMDSAVTTTTANENDKYLDGEAIASLLTKKVSDDKTSTLLLCANSMFVSDYYIQFNNSSNSGQIVAANLYDNKQFLANAVLYLTDRSDVITVRKDTGVATYTATVKEDSIIRAIISIIPIAILLFGFVIWRIRRRKK